MDGNRDQNTPSAVNNPKKFGPTLNDTFLGLLYPTENYEVYGYLTNTKVKFMVVTTDFDVRDTDVRNEPEESLSGVLDHGYNSINRHIPCNLANDFTMAIFYWIAMSILGAHILKSTNFNHYLKFK